MPSNTRLRAYTGRPLKVHGELIAHLKYQDQSADVPLLVVEGSGPSLFGRDWLSRIRLDWTKICNIRVSETDLPQGVASQLHTTIIIIIYNIYKALIPNGPTIQNHPNVFKPGLGTVKGITAKLEIKPDARPKFCKARPVPYDLQQAVEAEYNRLESEGIVERVEFSEWATPMVYVPKADGTTRSCGDYSVTVNPQLHVPQYPIPLPEDVFLKLRGGQRFTKLDLKSAYQQLPLDPESQELVTINTHRGLHRYKRLPFGIASSSALFQSTIAANLKHEINSPQSCLVAENRSGD